MKEQEAKVVVEGLVGWRDVVLENKHGMWYIVATDPVTHRRMVYDPTTGYFNPLPPPLV